MFNRTVLGAVAGLVCLATSTLAGVTVYNNFGDDNGGFDFQFDAGWTVAGNALPCQYGQGGVEQAFLFTPSSSGKLSDIWVALYAVSNAPELDQVRVAIARNVNDAFPLSADILEQWTVSSFGTSDAWFTPQHLVSVAKPALSVQSSYWVWISADVQTTWSAWGLNPFSPITLLHTLKRQVDTDWRFVTFETASALRVNAGCAGDFNGDGNISVQDIFDFLTAWFAGCA